MPAEGDEERYDVEFHMCVNPVCGCCQVELVWTPLDEPRGERKVSLDVVERRAADLRAGARREDVALARAVASSLTDEQWDLLRTELVATKRGAMERMDLDALRPEFPEEVATEALMVATKAGTTVPVGRNEPCPCGSGKKYKQCCGR